MLNLQDVLVITTSNIEGVKIKKYLKPVSAHIVAGTNLFSDFLGGLSDVFGGRSEAYQKQLVSLYNEAIARVKYAAYEIGGNCVLGLTIDMDEISGKGKSMFMLTAVGTAVIIEKEVSGKAALHETDVKLENVPVDRINSLRQKNEIIEKANAGTLELNDAVWGFITTNQVADVYPYLLNRYTYVLSYNPEESLLLHFYKQLAAYINGLPDNTQLDLLYGSIKQEENSTLIGRILALIKDLNLFDFDRCMDLLKGDDFIAKKRALRIITFDKPFYKEQDKHDLQLLIELIRTTFVERGQRANKKQLFSSKEKEVWTCECGKSNDVGNYCSGCEKDIYGFMLGEIKPEVVEEHLKQKIELISAFV